jgi:hypothetical protein
MKKLILIFLITLVTNVNLAQPISNFNSPECESNIFIELVKKLYNHKLTINDFSNQNLFFTTNVGGPDSEPYYNDMYDYENPKDLLKKFYQVFDSINKNGQFYHYYELINNSIIGYPLHQSFFMDDKNGTTYIVHIWNNKDDVHKIDGLNIHKKIN